MGSNEFITKCYDIVLDLYKNNPCLADITSDDIYVVWLNKTLQNNKALLGTTALDGMYFEITFNGNQSEFYADAYKKQENYVIKLIED